MKHNRQSGMVSIMVTMVMMLVISLIVLGFAQVSRREQRQSLDRQLSAQAFFAAETGVNDAREAIRKSVANGTGIPEKPDCGTDANYGADPVIDTTDNVSYSCLLVTTKLKNINISPLAAGGDSVNVPLEPATSSISSLSINWAAMTPPVSQGQISSNCKKPATGYFPSASAANWQCPYGVLRLDIVPVDVLNRATMTAGQKTIFLYPRGPGGPAGVSYAVANGAVATMNCVLATNCTVSITGMGGSTNYALRMSGLYVDGAVNITARDAGGASLELKNAQIQIDSTGKAQDVLRRIQVRLPLASSKSPDFALASGSSICKRFEVTDDSFAIPNTLVGQDQNNPTCKSFSVSPPTTGIVPCSLRGPNQVKNGNFAIGAGFSSTINPLVYGFTTNLPNRGPDVFPDDNGASGANADLAGWAGGLSVQTFPKVMNSGYVEVKPFLGDTTVSPAVPASNSSMMTNPNQSLAQPKPTNQAATYTGPLWKTTLTGLKPNTKYDFSGYFANVLTDAYYLVQAGVSPRIEFTVDGTLVRPAQDMPQAQSAWKRITLTFTTGPAQTQADFQIVDLAGDRTGDDFAMTQLGVYECL